VWFGIQKNVADQVIDQWRVCACVKAKGKHYEHMLCAVPQLSIICYETYITVYFDSQLLTVMTVKVLALFVQQF